MWPFSQRKAAEILEPEPLVGRRAALREELRELTAQLADIDARCLSLRTRYNLQVDHLLQIVGASVTEPAEIQRVRLLWRELQFKARPRLVRFAEVQRELASLEKA